MGFSSVDPSTIFVDEDPDLEKANSLFVDYDPDELQKMQAADIFSDTDPDALIEKTAKVKDIWKENTSENREARGQKIKEYMYAPEKTPEEIRNMSMWEKMQYAQDLEREFKYRQSKGFTKGVASGATFGLSEYIPGLEPEEDDLLNGFGEFVGSAIPITKIYNFLGKPIVKLAAKSPYVKNSLMALARMTGFGLTGATYEGTKEVVKTGEAPSPEDILKWGAQWALLDGTLQVAGKTVSFANKMRLVAKNNKNLTTQSLTNDIIKQLAKEKINPELNPEEYATRAEELLNERLPVEDRGATEPEVKQLIEEVKGGEKAEVPAQELKSVEPEGKKLDVSEEVKVPEVEPEAPKIEAETAKIEAKPSKLEAKKPKITAVQEKKSPKLPEPRHVDIPKEDLGKSPKEILAKHVQTGKPPWKPELPNVKQMAKNIETKVYNRYAPLKALGEGETSIFNKPRELAEQVKGFSSRAQSALRLAQYDAATGEMIGPAFEEIFLPRRLKQLTGKKKLDRADFDIYLAAKSSLERQNIGHKNPMPTKAAESFIRQNKSKYEPLAEDIYKFGRNQINNLVSEGLVSKEGAEKMFNMYQSHVPLYRVMPEELSLNEQIRKGLTGKTPASEMPQLPGASNLKVKQPIKRAKGSEKQILSPTESIVKNTYAFENAIMKNRAMKATGRGLEKQGFEVKEVGNPKMTKKEIAQAVSLPVEELESIADIEQVGEAINFLNPEQPRGKVRWYENGKLFEVSAPKDIIQAVEGLSPQQTNFVMKTLGTWKNAFSQGTVLQPGTLMRLSGMDMFVSSLQSKYPKWNGLMEFPSRVVYEYPRMLFNILKKGNLYKDYMQSGAAQISMQGIDRAQLASMTDTVTNALKTKNSLLMDTLKFPKKVVDGLRKTSEVLGDVPRLLEFERSMQSALKKGATKPEAMAQAAFDAFEVSVPYGRKGASKSLQAVYQMVPFMNTIVNSNVSLAKALNPKNPNFQSVVASGLGYLTVPTMYLYMQNRNDPRYQTLPQEDKDRNVYVYTTDDPNEEPLKFRKFWQYGYLFQTLPEHIAEYMFQKDPDAFKGLAKSFEYEFSPATMLSFSNAFRDGKFDISKLAEFGRYNLIPDRMKKIDAELQSTANTTETAKILAKYFNTSPIYIDHLVNMTGGGLGRDAIRLHDEFLYQTGLVTDKRPEKQAADSIFFGTWFGRGPSKRNQYMTEFYDYVDKFETMRNTAKALRAEGRDDEADKMMENYYDVSKMRKSFARYYKELEQIRYQHPDDLNGKEKRQELNRIYQEMTDLAKEYVEAIKEDTKGEK